MATHQIQKCKHGVKVKECRCPSTAKQIIVVKCPETCKSDDPSKFDSYT